MDTQTYLKPIPAGDIKKGMFVLLNDKTCKIVELHHAKTGKHGHMKVSLTGLCIFTQSKYLHICAGHQTLYQVEVLRKDNQVVAIYDDIIELLTADNEIERLETKDMELIDLKELSELYKKDESLILLTLTTAVENNEVVKKATGFKTI